MSVVEWLERNRYRVAAVALAAVAVLGYFAWTGTSISDLVAWAVIAREQIFTIGFAERTLQTATPIALAAIGGLYAEKSGVFNIGLEGFMIFGAVNAVAIAFFAAGGEGITQAHLWLGVVGAVLVGVVYTFIFAILLIRYKADQIVAGLAVWFLGLGFGPFMAVILWGSQNSPRVGSIENIHVPGLAELPVVGRLIFRASPLVILTIVVTLLAWWMLYRTRYGYWIQAAGENPSALDTAGVSVTRVRYASTVFSGAMAALAGAALAVAFTSGFTGTGLTMVDGRGWIGIVAYLFGNYNPIGAALAAVLFGGADMFQVQLQNVGVDVSSNLMGVLPYLIVVVVLTLYGKTRMPSRVGEPYESES